MPTNNSDNLLLLANILLAWEQNINRLEQFRIDILAGGDPVLDDGQLTKLNVLGKDIWRLKQELAEKTNILNKLKSAYYHNIRKTYGIRITQK